MSAANDGVKCSNLLLCLLRELTNLLSVEQQGLDYLFSFPISLSSEDSYLELVSDFVG